MPLASNIPAEMSRYVNALSNVDRYIASATPRQRTRPSAPIETPVKKPPAYHTSYTQPRNRTTLQPPASLLNLSRLSTYRPHTCSWLPRQTRSLRSIAKSLPVTEPAPGVCRAGAKRVCTTPLHPPPRVEPKPNRATPFAVYLR